MTKIKIAGVFVLGLLASSFFPHKPLLTPEKHESPTTQSERAFLDQAAHAFHRIAAQAMPSVVSVSAIKERGAAALEPLDEVPSGPASREHLSLGIGSGVIIRPDGYILTNNHVVENAVRVTVGLDEKHKATATIVGTDTKTDLAVIKLDRGIPPTPLTPIAFGDSDAMGIGDSVLAIGSPFGLNQTVTSGIVSAKGRGQMGILDIEDFIQTDAAINPGNSGGPLLNSKGEMIGLNTAIFSQSGGYMGIGFAIPSKIAKEISDELILKGKVTRGWLGLVAQDIDPTLSRFFKLPSADQKGALISDVLPEGPAGRAALRPGDIVVGFDRKAIESSGQFKAQVGQAKAGRKVPMEIFRDGARQTVSVDVQEQPTTPQEAVTQLAGQSARLAKEFDPNPPLLGLNLRDISPEIASYLGVSRTAGALVIGVKPGSPAFEAGLAPGDLIHSVNRREVSDAKGLSTLLRTLKPEEPVILYVQRGRQGKLFVPVPPLQGAG